MIETSRVVAVVPARGGSKSVPRKNIRLLGGKPLIAWSLDVAREVPEIDRVIVSTDNEEIASVARSCQAEVYKRPAHLATDEALIIDALRDLLKTLRKEHEDAEIMVLLEPTCPLRSVADVQDCIGLLVKGSYDSVATFKEAEVNPHRIWKIENQRPELFMHGAVPWLPRQKLPKAYQLNGAVYAFRTLILTEASNTLLFGKAAAIIMPPERSVDIDKEIDILVAEKIIEEGI